MILLNVNITSQIPRNSSVPTTRLYILYCICLSLLCQYLRHSQLSPRPTFIVPMATTPSILYHHAAIALVFVGVWMYDMYIYTYVFIYIHMHTVCTISSTLVSYTFATPPDPVPYCLPPLPGSYRQHVRCRRPDRYRGLWCATVSSEAPTNYLIRCWDLCVLDSHRASLPPTASVLASHG